MSTQPPSIVVGYDGSPDADAAATWAGQMARLRGEAVVVAIVVDRMESPRRPQWPESWWEEIEGQARETLAAVGVHDLAIERLDGGIASTLVDRATDASMLVLGSHGHGRVGEALLGSVSQSAARHSRCPVVVVRPAPGAHERRIIVGVDGSEPSLRALEFACRQAGATGDTVVLVRAWKPLTMPIDEHGDPPESMSRTLLEEEGALQKSVAEARTSHPEIRPPGTSRTPTRGAAPIGAQME